MHSELNTITRRGPVTLLALALLTVAAATGHADDTPAAAPAPVAAAAAPADSTAPKASPFRTDVEAQRRFHRNGPSSAAGVLEERIRLLTNELSLTSQQQVQMRMLLTRQNDAIRKVWADHSLTPGERGPITGAIGEATADAIRAMLTDEQRTHYNPPRPKPNKDAAENSQDLSKWLDAMGKTEKAVSP